MTTLIKVFGTTGQEELKSGLATAKWTLKPLYRVITASLLMALSTKRIVKRKAEDFLTVSLGKALEENFLSLCGRQMFGPSNLPVVVAQGE